MGYYKQSLQHGFTFNHIIILRDGFYAESHSRAGIPNVLLTIEILRAQRKLPNYVFFVCISYSLCYY